MARLILLDRDGVINLDSPAYIKDADEWVPIPGALEAIARLKRAGWLVGVCSNQAGIGRGILTEAGLQRVHRRMAQRLAEHGAALDGLRYCPHHPDEGCSCRKPAPGMLLSLMAELNAEPEQTLFVGDQLKDMAAARAAGCRPVLVRTGHGAASEAAARAEGVICVADDLAALAEHLLEGTPC
ncbi:MAG: D-glycero-beta-D-manno-heptose 1,7-bisphosphate 7-phosphatase [Pseudomonadales bacterium]